MKKGVWIRQHMELQPSIPIELYSLDGNISFSWNKKAPPKSYHNEVISFIYSTLTNTTNSDISRKYDKDKSNMCATSR